MEELLREQGSPSSPREPSNNQQQTYLYPITPTNIPLYRLVAEDRRPLVARRRHSVVPVGRGAEIRPHLNVIKGRVDVPRSRVRTLQLLFPTIGSTAGMSDE